MMLRNGKTVLFLAVLVVVEGQTKYAPHCKRNFEHELVGKEESDGHWCKTDPINLKLQDIDPDATMKLFPGLFHTEMELKAIVEKEDEFRKQHILLETPDYERTLSLPGDGASCCVTKREFFPNATLKNSQGELRYVVKLTVKGVEQLQYIPHGICMEGGKCTGRCIQEYRTHSVLVYDLQSNAVPPAKFEYFNIPSYCSCKNASEK
ncbi:hypothetical protein CHS0354_012236 [Potamilus streckersoni]|uniref:Spaetzle domain-containing protein n=1 Tax=Potamilus streckersoni TaxID=2493646 RepID=A0AAE0SA69_9BIVA|nr:hypothetical protein CHS0354_012236 [Potamilus streckersoni]